MAGSEKDLIDDEPIDLSIDHPLLHTQLVEQLTDRVKVGAPPMTINEILKWIEPNIVEMLELGIVDEKGAAILRKDVSDLLKETP